MNLKEDQKDPSQPSLYIDDILAITRDHVKGKVTLSQSKYVETIAEKLNYDVH